MWELLEVACWLSGLERALLAGLATVAAPVAACASRCCDLKGIFYPSCITMSCNITRSCRAERVGAMSLRTACAHSCAAQERLQRWQLHRILRRPTYRRLSHLLWGRQVCTVQRTGGCGAHWGCAEPAGSSQALSHTQRTAFPHLTVRHR